MLYDLHIHTNYSDGEATFQDVVYIGKSKNIGVSITDHNHIKGTVKGFNLAQQLRTDFLCGIEIGTREGKELLFYFNNPQDIEEFYKKEIEPFKTTRMTRLSREMDIFLNRDLYEEYNILFTTLPHPFGPLKKKVTYNKILSDKMINFVDSIEVINGTLNKKLNNLALELAQNKNKMMTASSDAHLIKDIGKVLTDITIEDGKLVSTKIMDNYYDRNTFKTLLQITKANINYSILKKGNNV
jgi:predicted metal-dependent phosphoesterase TrpH